MATLFFLTIDIYIGPTKLLKVDLPHAEYNLGRKFYKKYTSAN